MSIILVPGQVAATIGGFAGNNTIISLPNNPTAGNLVIVFMTSGGSAGTMTAVDGNSNSYAPTTSTPFSGSTARLGMFYLQNAPANANKNITLTDGTAPTGFQDIFAAEFSGAATTGVFESDATQSFGGASATINLPSITSINNGDLLIGGTIGYNTLVSADSPWTGIATAQQQSWAEYFVQATAGAQAIAFTQASSTFWDGMAAAFKAAPATGIAIWPYRT